MPANKTYETQRLLFRPTNTEDASFILALLNTPKWLKYIGNRQLNTVADAEAYIKNKMYPQLERLGFANNTIIRKSDNIKIGTCGLYDREGLDGIDIGFAFLPQYEKQGYAFEASNKLKDVAINEFGITKISGITTKDNTSSHKLLEKLGLKLMGPISLPNDDEELLLFELKIH
ncbi:MAG: GNAT family N-acetyltransferase [Flavobacteriales bacterium]|nr:GNAT family N-acetyltransferase [Flavobacteriales bacterium]